LFRREDAVSRTAEDNQETEAARHRRGKYPAESDCKLIFVISASIGNVICISTIAWPKREQINLCRKTTRSELNQEARIERIGVAGEQNSER